MVLLSDKIAVVFYSEQLLCYTACGGEKMSTDDKFEHLVDEPECMQKIRKQEEKLRKMVEPPAGIKKIMENEVRIADMASAATRLSSMNLPSFEKFEPTVKKGGIVIADSSLIEAKSTRTDIDVHYIPATSLASDMGRQSLANMVILGKLLSVMGEFDEEKIKTVLSKVIPPKKAEMLEINIQAMKLGANN